jgi:outer membrane protein TolC
VIRTLLALILLVPAPAYAEAPVEVYNLDRSLKSAVDNSTRIQIAEKDIRIAEDRASEAKLRFLPEVGLQASGTRYNANRAFAIQSGNRSHLLFPSPNDYLYAGGAYLALNLYDGRRNINTLRLARTALKQARSKFEVVRLDVAYAAKRAFYQYLLADRLLRATEELLTAADKAATRKDSGPWQAVESGALAAKLRTLVSQREHELSLKHLSFLRSLNIELDRPVSLDGEVSTDPVDVDLRKALVWATELRPEMQSQTYKAQMDAIGVNLELGRRYPTVALGVDYELVGENFPLRQNNWDATIGIRIPLSMDFWTQHNQKVSEQRQAEIMRAEIRDQVHLEVRRAHKEVMHWQEEWRRREKDYRALRRLFDRARGTGARPVDAYRAADRVLSAQHKYLEAVTQHILSRARLERAVGRTLPGAS